MRKSVVGKLILNYELELMQHMRKEAILAQHI